MDTTGTAQLVRFDPRRPPPVTVVSFDIPFFQLTWFLIKLSFASALAFMVTSVVWGTILGVFFAAVSALGALLLGFLSTMGS